ncbi:MAG: hypothetical protein AABX48_04355 [Nanoarchaeota archaeon]
MNLPELCIKGEVNAEDFIKLIRKDFPAPHRTNILSKGDYALIRNSLNRRIVKLERVEEIDYLEHGDFLTENGTTGPIRGNVFVKIDSKSPYGYILMEGDDVSRGNGSAYDQILDYLERKVA